MNNNLNILNIQGDVVGEFPIADNCLEFEKGQQAVHDVVVAFMAGERSGTGSSKTRSEVRGGDAKPFRQKGMGRARSGSIRNPLWKGGGVIFGPKPRSFEKKVNKKTKTLALKRAFSEKIKEESVILVDSLSLADHKTKSAVDFLSKFKIENQKVLLVVTELEDNLVRAARNLPNILLLKSSSLNVYQLLYHNKVVFAKDAMDKLLERFNPVNEQASE